MITLNTIIQQAGLAYRGRGGDVLSDQQHRVLAALAVCRTEALGGQVFTCPACQSSRYSYHSCRNRHCPTCQQGAGERWLADQHTLLLPVPYFLVTFTIPASLRAIAAAHQRVVYTALFRASAAALQQDEPAWMVTTIVRAGVAVSPNEGGHFLLQNVDKRGANGQPYLLVDERVKGRMGRLTVEDGLGILGGGSHDIPPNTELWLSQG